MDTLDFSTEPSSPTPTVKKSPDAPRSDRRSVFPPGVIERRDAYRPAVADVCETRPMLSQEKAERLQEHRRPGDVKYVFCITDDPEAYLQEKQEVIHAEAVDYVRIHEGNLEDRLRLHTGDYDVPSGRTESQAGHDEVPLDLNLEEYRLLLQRGKVVFQMMYYDWTFADEDGDPTWSESSSPDYPEVEERPEGWLSIQEVCQLKDQNQSAVTRAIRHGEITVVMQRSPRKRWVRPDEAFDRWSPGRQSNYLLRRRLQLVMDTMQEQLHRPSSARSLSHSSFMKEVRQREARNHGIEHLPEGSYQSFFEEELGEDCPSSMKEWALMIGQLIDRYCR